jgi:vitamin B12 transporter
LELGVVDRAWAKRLLVRAFYSTYDKDLQNNMVMTIPYGEVIYGETVYGATARYEVAPSDDTELELVANYSHRTIDFNDESEWIYNWRGERVRERVATQGEVDPAVAGAMDRTLWQGALFGRAMAAWKPAPGHTLRASLAPTATARTGKERIVDVEAFDPLRGDKKLFTLVAGLAYELEAFAGRFSNVAFVKHYTYRADSEEALKSGVLRDVESKLDANGVGDSLRFDFTPWLYLKSSYELATRLPSPDEIFGNGVLIHQNLSLVPETSHNANLGPRLSLKRTKAGGFVVDVNVFLRETKNLIVLLGTDSFYTYQNVYAARSTGLEQSLSFTSPGEWMSIDGSLTWQENRNLSSAGPFKMMQGDRMPNRPYLFGTWSGRLRIPKVMLRSGILEPFYFGRYVHSFYRGWESLGLRQYKQVVPTQVLHSVGVSWSMKSAFGRLTTTLEVDNLSDAKAYDNYGVQRPGRAFYAKLRGEI